MIRFLRGLAALLVVGAVVIGGPIALLRFGRLNAFTQLDWGRLLSTPDDGTLVLGLVTVIGWVAWALATASLLSEALAALSSQRWRLRLPGIAIFAPASAVLVTAIIGLVSAQLLTPAPAQATAVQASDPAPTAAAGLVALQAPARNVAPTAPVDGLTHTVVPGDDLWSLAEHYYSDGSRWREILTANDTVLLDATQLLLPGMVLHIPDAGPRPAAEASVIVQAGDTLSSLAAEHLGDAQRWPELAAANPDRVGDPDVIDVGWQLRLPGGVEQLGVGQPPQGVESAEQAVAPSQQAENGHDQAASSEVGPGEVEQPEVTESTSPTVGIQPCPAPPAPLQERAPQGQTPDSTDTSALIEAGVWAATLPASFGAVLCAGLAGAYALRRRQQQTMRPLGRRLPPLPPLVTPVHTALASVVLEDADPLADVLLDHVPLGEVNGQIVHRDLTSCSVVSLTGSDGAEVSMATALVLSLAAADPAEEPLAIVAVGPQFEWLNSLDEPRIQVVPKIAAGQAQLAGLVAERTAGRPAGTGLAQLQADPLLAAAWTPIVFVLPGSPDSVGLDGLSELGITVIACAEVPAAGLRLEVADGQAIDQVNGEVFVPYLVDLPARRALTELFSTAGADQYPTAPWWNDEPNTAPTPLRSIALLPVVKDLPVTASVESEHPVVNLLGPVELVGARGPVPNRALKQCAEYCAWLLENPGAGAPAMSAAMQVAETTRRSNMSRLRSWLGEAPDGQPYLPDAYTGRITLHPGVTSDWEQLRMYLHGGINKASDEALLAALSLVRGAPLADAAPGQWHWAEQLRADMVATIRDAAVVLGRRAIEAGDAALATWAVSRAGVAAPDDQLLAALQIRLAHLTGDQAEVDRLVLQLTRNARVLGVDLSDDVVVLLQEVVEGRARLRRA